MVGLGEGLGCNRSPPGSELTLLTTYHRALEPVGSGGMSGGDRTFTGAALALRVRPQETRVVVRLSSTSSARA